MNRINPLYIGMLLIFVLFFLVLKLENAKDELNFTKQSFNKTKKLAVDTSSLKNVYENKKFLKNSILSIISRPILRDSSIVKDISSSGIVISSDNMNLSSLNFLMSKVLNMPFNITILEIRRLSNTKSSLKMEIKW